MWLFFSILVCLHASAFSNFDIHLHCPPEDWQNGTEVTLTCSLNKLQYPSKCASHSDVLDFLLNPESIPTPPPECTVTGFSGCSPSTAGQTGCRCIEDNVAMNTYTFEYKFIADISSAGNWTCRVVCYNGLDLALTETSDNCTDRSVVAQPTAPPTTEPTFESTTDHPCPDCERRLCHPKWVIALIIFGLFRVFAIVYFVLYVLFAAYKSLWPFNRSLACGILACCKLACGILAWWVILLMCLATAFFPECVVLCIIDAILWRPCCCLDCISVPRRILLLVLAIVICLASIIYMIVARIVQLWPFPEISVEECPDFECVHEGWQIFLFVVSCIGIAILICFLIAFLCERPPDRGLWVKCGSCHKWRRFIDTLDDNKLQDIFTLETLNEIFKKCDNHDQAELSLERIEQKIQEILTKREMADIRNVKLNQTVCLKDNESNEWYLQEPGVSNGTYVDRGEMVEILQIRLYLLSKDGHEGAVEMGRVNNVSSAH